MPQIFQVIHFRRPTTCTSNANGTL